MTIEKRKEQVLAMLTALHTTHNKPIAITWPEFLKHYGLSMSTLSYILNNFITEYSAVDARSLYQWKADLLAPTMSMAIIMIKDLHLDNHDLFEKSKVSRQEIPDKYLEALQGIYDGTKDGSDQSLSDFRKKYHLSGRFMKTLRDFKYVIYEKQSPGKRSLKWNTDIPNLKMVKYLLHKSKRTRESVGITDKAIIDRPWHDLWKALGNVLRP